MLQVAVLVQFKGRVLITRRAASLRSFPDVWVVPGGHWEKGETLAQAGVREVRSSC